MNLPPTKYFGSIKFERTLKNYHVSISHHNIGEKIPKHNHANPYYSVNLGAAYIENNNFSKSIIDPGTIILRPKEYEHENTFINNVGFCFNIEVITISNNNVLQLFNNKNINFAYFEFLQILIKTFNNYSDNELDCLITETLADRYNTQLLTKIPNWYNQVISKVKEEYCDSLTLSEIASSVALHPNYLARKFKKISGITLGDYIRMVRLKNASLMLHSNKRLTDIALEAGFYDQSHFSNSFRSAFKISPKSLKDLFLG
ncbi:helix-turn-helix transcriptional regulator [Changchengzhania lutea]|uniref:helix-turn-helix transcriptional regulator n=1 Tax=Changchengzhania lutea TaxID=2049305 RepID=UPI00115E52D9|nr:helix-turn-helix transcriptional regulator [Changchengzhania lutea]